MTYLPSIPIKSKNPKIAMLRINCSDNPLTIFHTILIQA